MLCSSSNYPGNPHDVKIPFALQRNPLNLEFWWVVRLKNQMKKSILNLSFKNMYAMSYPRPTESKFAEVGDERRREWPEFISAQVALVTLSSLI